MRRLTTPLLSLLLIAFVQFGHTQIPQGFSFQAVVRNDNGNPIADQAIKLKVSLQDQAGTNYFVETHSTTTTSLGVINLIIGTGLAELGSIENVPWESGAIFINVAIDPSGGTNFTEIGPPTKLMSVPYALYTNEDKVITSDPNALEDDPIFVVKNKDDKIVFAVYQGGVRVYVEDTPSGKGAKGGFAVGGLTNQTKEEVEYFRITPDSARVYVNEIPVSGKGRKGGFAVGGLTNQTKITTSRDLMLISPDSARIWVNSEAAKGAKGGFAVGGLTNKKDASNFMLLTPDNYFIGHEAGTNTTDGLFNIFIGYESGYSNTTGHENAFIGHESGWSNTAGFSNVFLGNGTGFYNTEGMYNVLIGNYAGNHNTTGFSNVIIGDAAGEKNTTGNSNVFIGDWSGASNTEGEENIFIGNAAGWTNNTGKYNLFLGGSSGYLNTTGEGNVFLGDETGYNNNGNWNVFLGNSSGYSNLVGENNVFLGIESGHENKQGNNNVFIGSAAGYENMTGSNNVFLGSNAGYYETKSDRLYIENTDTDSTDALIFGNFENDVLQVNYSLGVGRYPEENEFEVEGDASKATAGSWFANSDRRIKTDISEIDNAYEILLKLHPVKFRYSDEWMKLNPSIKNKYYYNFIAQEYQQVFPESVKGSGEYLENDTQEVLQIDSYNAEIVTIKAVQELIVDNKNQQKIIEKQQAEIDHLKAELADIKAILKR